jgi:hypothetical protein
MKTLRPLLLIPVLITFATIVARRLRPWYLHWGATDEEIQRPMPMDDHVPTPRLDSTMAITIEAPPGRIWPWLVQMGDAPRAGYYSYAWIERLLGMDIENSRRVLPAYQRVEVGDALDRAGTMTVLAVEPGHHLVLGPPPSVDTVRASWAFALYPIDEGRTRLVTRVHGDWSWRGILRDTPVFTWPFYLLMEPGAFLMERRLLLGIRDRAEAMAI